MMNFKLIFAFFSVPLYAEFSSTRVPGEYVVIFQDNVQNIHGVFISTEIAKYTSLSIFTNFN